MKYIGRIFVVLLPIGILVVAGFFGSQLIASMRSMPQPADEEPKGLAVFVAQADSVTLPLEVRTQGEVRPKRQIALVPQVSGRIAYKAPNFQEGGFVRNRQILVRLEQEDYDLMVTQAQSNVATAEQALQRELAEADLARQEIADLGFENASPLALREPQLAQARAAVAAAEAALRDAELRRDRTKIVAPFDGRVRDLNVNIGQYVTPGQTLGQIFATDAVEVPLPLSNEELGRLGLSIAFEETAAAPGPKVVFTDNVAGQSRTWTGRITRTGAALNPGTRSVTAIAEVENPYEAPELEDGTPDPKFAPMAPGLFPFATIEGRVLEDVVRIPRQALRGADRVLVADLETSTLDVRDGVGVVYSDDQYAYILAGVDAGDYVITSPMQTAVTGQSLTFADPDIASMAKRAEPEAEAGSGS